VFATLGIPPFRKQYTVASRQSSVISHQSSVVSRQSPVVNRAPVASAAISYQGVPSCVHSIGTLRKDTTL